MGPLSTSRLAPRRRAQRRRGLACLASLLALGAFLLLASSAWALESHDFCPAGEGAGQCAALEHLSDQLGLATDTETGRLYAADEGNDRIDVFSEAGSFLFAFGWGVADGVSPALQSCGPAATPPTATCFKGLPGAGAGQFDGPTEVAVDNSPTSLSRHDVYVVDEGNHRIEKFGADGSFVWSAGSKGEAEGQFEEQVSIGVGPAGTLYALDNIRVSELRYKQRLQRFEPSGTQAGAQCVLFEGGLALSLAVRSDGGFWVANTQGTTSSDLSAIRRYDSACAVQGEPLEPDVETTALALDEAGRLFALQGEGLFRVITAYDSSGAIASRFGYGTMNEKPRGFAVREGGEGGLFVSLPGEGGIGRLRSPSSPPDLPPPGPIATGVEVRKPIGASRATAVAEVNPEGKRPTVHVEYLTQAQWEAQGDSFVGPATKETAPEEKEAEGFSLVAVQALIGCPDPAEEFGKPGSGCLSPETEYRFRYVAESSDGAGEGTVEGQFETGPPIEIGDVFASEAGTDTAKLSAQVDPEGVPATGYFEYVDDASFQADLAAGGDGFAEASKAPDVDGGQKPLDFGDGEGELFTRSVSAYPLQPGTTYHYRLVVDNPVIEPIEGEAHTLLTFATPASEACPENEASRIGAGALLPDCRAYELVSPLDKAGGDIRVLGAEDGAPSMLEQAAPSGEALAYNSSRSFGEAPSSAPYTSQYIARRVAGFEWQTQPINPSRGRQLADPPEQTNPEFQAFSPDLCEGWLETYAELPGGEAVPGYVPGYRNLLRDRLCGAPGYEALAPLAKPAKEQYSALLKGLSPDGSHAIFTVKEGEGQRQLYESVEGAAPRPVCFLPGGKTPVSDSCTAGSEFSEGNKSTLTASLTGAISVDGQRIFFSVPGSGEGKLYERVGGTQSVAVSQTAEGQAGTEASWFWGAAADGSRVIFTTGDLTNGKARLYEFDTLTKTTHLLAEGVYGVMGMSEDAQRIYFASSKVLAPGQENSAGREAEERKPNLYLDEAGQGMSYMGTLSAADIQVGNNFNMSPVAQLSFQHTARVSPNGLSAAFVSSGSPTGYDNKEASSGKATTEAYLYDAASKNLVCPSCNPSGARPAGPSSIPPFESALHAARVLAEDGSRLYFESSDRLSPRDSNGAVDVYQWEAPGTGSCEEEAPGYSPQDGGCVDLISSGQAPLDARFVEADPEGENVFFATAASLLPQDYGLVDIYDARVNGGLPIPQASPPSCEGEACQSPVEAPSDPTPASSSFAGSGNVKAASHAKKKHKHKKRRHRRAHHSREAGR